MRERTLWQHGPRRGDSLDGYMAFCFCFVYVWFNLTPKMKKISRPKIALDTKEKRFFLEFYISTYIYFIFCSVLTSSFYVFVFHFDLLKTFFLFFI